MRGLGGAGQSGKESLKKAGLHGVIEKVGLGGQMETELSHIHGSTWARKRL